MPHLLTNFSLLRICQGHIHIPSRPDGPSFPADFPQFDLDLPVLDVHRWVVVYALWLISIQMHMCMSSQQWDLVYALWQDRPKLVYASWTLQPVIKLWIVQSSFMQF